jgi:hypothetical protein
MGGAGLVDWVCDDAAPSSARRILLFGHPQGTFIRREASGRDSEGVMAALDSTLRASPSWPAYPGAGMTVFQLSGDAPAAN